MLVNMGDIWINPNRVACLIGRNRTNGELDKTNVLFSGHDEDYVVVNLPARDVALILNEAFTATKTPSEGNEE